MSNVDIQLEHVQLPADPSSEICTPTACRNAHLNSEAIQSFYTISSPSTTIPVDVLPKWSSLFKALPRNAGSFSPRTFDMVVIDGVNVPAIEVVQEGVNYWSEYLVCFFLILPYRTGRFVTTADGFGT